MFVPSTVSISRCDSVKAVDVDATVAHTFTGPSWDSGQMTSSANSSYTVRFTSTGTFHFYCTYHQSVGMTGTITVT
jgi:plastocyanin